MCRHMFLYIGLLYDKLVTFVPYVAMLDLTMEMSWMRSKNLYGLGGSMVAVQTVFFQQCGP